MEEKRDMAKTIKAAFTVSIPVLCGFLILGIAYGILMTTNGYGPLWSLLMSLVAFGGSMQYVAIQLLISPFAPLEAFLLAILVNARHMFYGLAILDKYKNLGLRKIFMVFALCDETFSLVSTLEPPEGVRANDFYLFITIFDYSYWAIGTLIGALAGNFITFDTTGMDFVLTALFVVLFLEQWKKKENRIAGLIGIVCTVISLLVFGPSNMVIPAMVLIMMALIGGRKKICS